MKIINKHRNFNKQVSPYKLQAGLSLIELLISVLIGLFLLGGVITNFIGTKDSDRTRAAISEMDANAKTALGAMRQTITHAGYPSIYNIRLPKAFFTQEDYAVLTNPLCQDGVTKRDKFPPQSKNRTRDRSRGDVITIVTLADNPCVAGLDNCSNEANVNPDALVYYDCLGGGSTRDEDRVVSCSADNTDTAGPGPGMDNPEDAKIYSSFRLGEDSNKRTLYCDGSRGNSQPLVNGVEAMQILYGVKDGETTTYKRANKVEQFGEWGMVTSVQVALLLRSSSKILKQDSQKTKYTLLDNSWDISDSDLRHLFRVYTTTINLENLNKGALL